MANKAKLTVNTHYDDKPETRGLITKAKNTVGKALEQTSPFAVIGGVVIGAVAICGLWVIGSTDCGGSLSFKSSPSSQEFQLKKEACKLPDVVAK